jgi:hypothetical protein
MVKEMRRVDVTKNAELLRLAQEVADTGDGVILQTEGTDLVTMLPAATRPTGIRRKRSKADLEAFWASAGSWADVDVDEFLRNVYEGRELGTRVDR